MKNNIQSNKVIGINNNMYNEVQQRQILQTRQWDGDFLLCDHYIIMCDNILLCVLLSLVHPTSTVLILVTISGAKWRTV